MNLSLKWRRSAQGLTMDKNYFSPMDMLQLSVQHVYVASQLIEQDGEIEVARYGHSDALAPVASLMYIAFELMLKAFLAHDHRPVKQHKNLLELVELSPHLELSSHEQKLLKTLSRRYAFRKGVDYFLFDDRQSQVIFCIDIIKLYDRMQTMMPLELQQDYNP